MKNKGLRYIVTGPHLEGEPSYADPGPALSRTLTAALRANVEGTWYARDSITDNIIGYTEIAERADGVLITSTVRRKA